MGHCPLIHYNINCIILIKKKNIKVDWNKIYMYVCMYINNIYIVYDKG